ncbi:hypothetical protein EYF80_044281 [Liparis tanakae]|uniref:Uncharacterized protein n=1 Tax=Liparis tanakae TaxID=230148 RepID=A0A4Z2FWC6_9TELE|nr:hypothetical protein EYF80_044281 [Liparis tanakae]
MLVVIPIEALKHIVSDIAEPQQATPDNRAPMMQKVFGLSRVPDEFQRCTASVYVTLMRAEPGSASLTRLPAELHSDGRQHTERELLKLGTGDFSTNQRLKVLTGYFQSLPCVFNGSGEKVNEFNTVSHDSPYSGHKEQGGAEGLSSMLMGWSRSSGGECRCPLKAEMCMCTACVRFH